MGDPRGPFGVFPAPMCEPEAFHDRGVCVPRMSVSPLRVMSDESRAVSAGGRKVTLQRETRELLYTCSTRVDLLHVPLSGFFLTQPFRYVHVRLVNLFAGGVFCKSLKVSMSDVFGSDSVFVVVDYPSSVCVIDLKTPDKFSLPTRTFRAKEVDVLLLSR